MQIKIKIEDIEKIRNILKKYNEENLDYNEPHFTLKLERLKIDRKEVIKNILNPDKLVLVGISESKNPNYEHIYDLYFRLSKNRMFKIPVSIKPKSLYLVTIFKIRRKIQDEAIKYYRK